MTDKQLLETVLEALETPVHEQPFGLKQKAITALKARLEQTEQEPKFVRIVDGVPCITLAEHKHLMATTPPSAQRQLTDVKSWAGLTPEEIVEILSIHYMHMSDLVQAIEAKLKDKNT